MSIRVDEKLSARYVAETRVCEGLNYTSLLLHYFLNYSGVHVAP